MTEHQFLAEDPDSDEVEVRDPFFNKVKRVVTSATLLILAYLLVFLLQQFITGGLCFLFGYHPKITFNDIGNLPFEYTYWSFLRVLVIFSASPVICLLLAFLALDIFHQQSGRGSLSRFFFLWLAVCCINIFLGFLLLSPLGVDQYYSGLYVGFSIVGTWTRMGLIVTSPLSLASAAVSIFAGYFLFESIMKFSFSSRLLQTSNGQRSIIIQLYLLPVLVAVPVLISLTTFKSMLLHSTLALNLLLISMGLFIGVRRTAQNMLVFKQDVLNTFPLVWLLLTMAVYALIWIFLRGDEQLIF